MPGSKKQIKPKEMAYRRRYTGSQNRRRRYSGYQCQCCREMYGDTRQLFFPSFTNPFSPIKVNVENFFHYGEAPPTAQHQNRNSGSNPPHLPLKQEDSPLTQQFWDPSPQRSISNPRKKLRVKKEASEI